LLETAYEETLAHELAQAGLTFERQRETPLLYKGIELSAATGWIFSSKGS